MSLGLNDYVVLRIGSNANFLKIIDAQIAVRRDSKLKIDLENGVWCHEDVKPQKVFGGFFSGYKIGTSASRNKIVIGVYDRTDNGHLENMINESIRNLR